MDVELSVCWNGAQGWIGSDYGKGALIPPVDGASTLTDVARRPAGRHSDNPMIRAYPRRGGKPRKYDAAMREAVRAMRQDGFSLQEIAERLNVPLRSAHYLVTGR